MIGGIIMAIRENVQLSSLLLVTVPLMLLAIGITVVLPPGLFTVMLALALVGWASFARLARSLVLSLMVAFALATENYFFLILGLGTALVTAVLPAAAAGGYRELDVFAFTVREVDVITTLAHVCATAGFPVTLVDVSADALANWATSASQSGELSSTNRRASSGSNRTLSSKGPAGSRRE